MIRPLQESDIDRLGDLHFPWMTKEATLQKWQRYFHEDAQGIRLSFIIELEREIAGYGHLLFVSEYPYFRNHSIPEIHDLWIFEKWRKKGLGSLLITHLEEQAKQRHYSTIGLGVGLYRDYGEAQRLYFRLGYEPVGEGITYQNVPINPGDSYPVDDDLILWLHKHLKDRCPKRI